MKREKQGLRILGSGEDEKIKVCVTVCLRERESGRV